MGSAIGLVARPVSLLTILLCVAAPSARAATSSDDAVLADTALTQLETRAESAPPRDQCFLYTELVNDLTEVAGKQLAAGDTTRAGMTIRRIDTLAQKIHMSLARDTRRIKNAELLMHHTTRRLADMLHVAPNEDRPVLQSTLNRLDSVQTELLTQVFIH
ncbi:MAG TPA: hypothetical protein VIJ79_01355 [Acidobacteriaceae bacterium]